MMFKDSLAPHTMDRLLSHPQAGVGLGLFAALCWVLMDGVVQRLETAHHVSPGQNIFLRMVSCDAALTR